MADWNPFEDIASLHREIDRAFEGFGVGQSPSRRVAFLPADRKSTRLNSSHRT